jgi:putative SOS response-associated peptidase YedK
MCGRYDLNATALQLAARFGVPAVSLLSSRDESLGTGVAGDGNAGWHARYNIAPTQHNPVVVRDAGGHDYIEWMRWGLVPSWAKEDKISYSTINARVETLSSKPTFRKPLATQRCLVPATGYFEWVQDGTAARLDLKGRGKQPYRITLRDESADGIFAFAGLYDIWQGPGNEALHTYTIVTTQANNALSAIHSRMPVILPGDAEGEWLDGSNRDIEHLISLLQPYPEAKMNAYPVSRLVNNPSNDMREVIEAMSLSLAA